MIDFKILKNHYSMILKSFLRFCYSVVHPSLTRNDSYRYSFHCGFVLLKKTCVTIYDKQL